MDRESAVGMAKKDLARRLGVSEADIKADVVDREFPDMSLGAPASGEMSAQMIATGWQIRLKADGRNYEYRADKHQLRLKDFKGKNHVIVS
jgi:hypothetical protein